MKLKLDDSGHVVVEDGKPVYVGEDGKDVAIDVVRMQSTISARNKEAQGHRERAEELEAKLKAFEGIEDPEAALKAIETVSKLDQNELVAAGKLEEVRTNAKKAADEQVAAAVKKLTAERDALIKERDTIRSEYHGEKIRSEFAGSKFISEKIGVPVDMIQAAFGKHFSVEDGKLIARDASGNVIPSKSNFGDNASFDEAIETLVDAYPYRDHILKGHNGGGSGQRGGAAGSKDLTRSQFDKMPQAERTAKLNEGYKVVSD